MAEFGAGSAPATSDKAANDFANVECPPPNCIPVEVPHRPPIDPLLQPHPTPADRDGDGLTDQEELLLCSCPTDKDSDDDGLEDGWEYRGVVGVKPYGLTLRHKDVLVWMDWNDRSDLPDDLDEIARAFADAPVPNPDGTPGIHLIVDIAEEPAKVATDTPSRLPALLARRRRALGAARTMMHYMIWANRIDADEHSGVALEGAHGPDFIVSLGSWLIAPESAKIGTFMHEIGHTFGLRHGGRHGRTVSEHPSAVNHLSVMSYRYQTVGVRYGRGRSFTYQWDATIGLDEAHLDEYAGIGKSGRLGDFRVEWDDCTEFADSAIDWNHQHDLEHSVQWDLDGDHKLSKLPPIESEWDAVDLTSDGVIGSHFNDAELDVELRRRAAQADVHDEIKPGPALQRAIQASVQDHLDLASQKLQQAIDAVSPSTK